MKQQRKTACLLASMVLVFVFCFKCDGQEISLADAIDSTQPKMVKIFGGGGFQRLESWQSGFFVSPEGLIATVWSYVLDTETAVVLDDGRRLNAELIGYHPQFEIALLKVDVENQACFTRQSTGQPQAGQPVLAFSNLYGVANGNEQCSVQSGIVSATTSLNARRGVRQVTYNGPAILVDAIINNPGAAGGALTDQQGNLMGLIGRESRSVESGLWLNYALPTEQLWEALDSIRSGQMTDRSPPAMPTEFLTLELLGLVLLPNVVDRTPPFVDQVVIDSAAARAGIQPDDLVIEVAGNLVVSRADLIQKLREIDRDSSVSVMIQRDETFLTLEMKVR